MNEERDETKSGLIWITCPHCGVSFRIGLPNRQGFSIHKKLDSYLPMNRYSECACPKCSKEFFVTYLA
jgi:hypothetical protein